MSSEIKDKIQLLELRTKKAVTLINLLRNNNKQLQTENNSIKSSKDDLQIEFDAFKETSSDTSELEEIQQQLEDWKAKYETLTVEHSALTEEHSALTEEHETLTEDHNILTVAHDKLKADYAKLKMDYTFANNRIIELQSYVDDYKDNTKLLEDSISKSIDTLDAIEGLDDIDLLEAQNTELETAEGFTSGQALNGDDLSDLDDLGDDLILEGDDSDLLGLDELEDLDDPDSLN